MKPRGKSIRHLPPLSGAGGRSRGGFSGLSGGRVHDAAGADRAAGGDVRVPDPAVGLDGAPDASPPDKLRLDGSLALVIGNEGQGMRSLVRETCDLLLRLPMRGRVESLNAAVAGSVALYLAWQARGFSR